MRVVLLVTAVLLSAPLAHAQTQTESAREARLQRDLAKAHERAAALKKAREANGVWWQNWNTIENSASLVRESGTAGMGEGAQRYEGVRRIGGNTPFSDNSLASVSDVARPQAPRPSDEGKPGTADAPQNRPDAPHPMTWGGE
jgi:hypothetical protein